MAAAVVGQECEERMRAIGLRTAAPAAVKGKLTDISRMKLLPTLPFAQSMGGCSDLVPARCGDADVSAASRNEGSWVRMGRRDTLGSTGSLEFQLRY